MEKYQYIYERIILKWQFKNSMERDSVGSIDLPQGRNKWQAFVNTVMKFWVP
jgi:hypothetical protein